MAITDNRLVNAMTVDVEDYYQVSAFEKTVRRADWANHSSRVEANMERILALFDRYHVKATFFTLGWIAEKHPQLVRRIVEQGHELASHGWDHQRASDQSRAEFTQDVCRAKAQLEDVSGQLVQGYRAPSYSIGKANLWALDVLADSGHRYSSSIVPIRHDHYGMPEASRFAFPAASGRLLEIPVTTVPLFSQNINVGGGGWFRLFPYFITRQALRRVNQRDGQPCNFYFHPWEIDPDQPRIQGLAARSRFRHYLNLDKTYARLEQLLTDFHWGRMDEIFLPQQRLEVTPQLALA